MNKLRIIFRKVAKARFYAGLILVGLVFLIGGIFFTKSSVKYDSTTIATVTDITSEYNADDTYTYTATITYKDVEGNDYTGTIGASSSWTIGKEVTIYYNSSEPRNIATSNSNFWPYVMLGVGGFCVVFSVVRIVMIAVKTPDEENEFNKVNMSEVSSAQVEEIKNNDEPLKDYYFHYTTGINQNYIFKTTDNEVIMEAKNQKLSIVSKYQYNFINHKTGKEELKVCSHTAKKETGDTHGLRVETDANFKINGENCWTVLGKTGFSVEPHVKDLHLEFDIKKYGVNVGNFEQAGTNIATGKDYKLGNVPSKGIYKVHCRESDIENVFLACFVIARTIDY